MDAERAEGLGRAFALGYVYGHGVLMAQDEAKWITVHPNGTGANANGEQIKGRPLLIDDETGTILGGMGGKGKGKKLTDFKTSRKKMTFKSSGSASKPAKPHHNNRSLAGSGPFAAMARKFAREHPENSPKRRNKEASPAKIRRLPQCGNLTSSGTPLRLPASRLPVLRSPRFPRPRRHQHPPTKKRMKELSRYKNSRKISTGKSIALYVPSTGAVVTTHRKQSRLSLR